MPYEIVLGIVAIILAIIAIWMQTHTPEENKETMQKLKISSLTPSTRFMIAKCAVIILVIWTFLDIATMWTEQGKFDPWILHTVGFWILLFLGVLTIEYAGEKGDKYAQQSGTIEKSNDFGYDSHYS